MALQSYALTTTARVKAVIGIANNNDDAVITQLINSVTNFVENYCRRRFQKTAYTNEKYDGDGSKDLLVRQTPIISTETIKLEYRQSNDNNASWSEVSTNDYVVDFNAGVVHYEGGFFKGFQNWRLSYTAGYDIDTSSKTLESVGLGDLEWAVWELVKKAFKQRKQASNVSRSQVGDVSVTYRDTVMGDPLVKEVLDEYKLDI